MAQEGEADVEAQVNADKSLAEDAVTMNGSRKPDEDMTEAHATEAAPVAGSALQQAKEHDGAAEQQQPEQPATSAPECRGDDSKAGAHEDLGARRSARRAGKEKDTVPPLQSKTSHEAPSTSKPAKAARGGARGARGTGASQEHQEQGPAEKAKRGKRARQDSCEDSDHEEAKEGSDGEHEPEKQRRSGAGRSKAQGAKGRSRGGCAAAADEEGQLEQAAEVPRQAPGSARRKGKGHTTTDTVQGGPERQEQQPQRALKLAPDPKSAEYQSLDHAGKLSAFQAASEAYLAALKAADEARKVVESHAEAWHSEPMDMTETTKGWDFVIVFRNARASHRPYSEALRTQTPCLTELLRLWKYMHSNKAEFGTEATAKQAMAKAGPPAPFQGQGQAAGRPQQGVARAGSANGQPDAKQGPGPAAAAKVVKLEAAVQKPGLQAGADDARPAASPAYAVKQPSTAQQRSRPGSSPAPAVPAVHLVSVRSTGNPSRDRTVAALFQALSSAGAVDMAEVAVQLEQHVFEAKQQQDGSVGPAYMRRAFLLWSLLAPDSEAFCSEVHEAVLQGLLQPEDLARMDLGDQVPGQAQG